MNFYRLWRRCFFPFRTAYEDAFIEAFHRQVEQDQVARGIPADLDGYREKFKRNLLGNWTTDPGYGPFAVTKWRFFADGRAQELYLSGMGDRETRFLWREADDFSIQMIEVEDEEEPPQWFRLSYDFKIEDGRVVLLQTPEDGTFKFYHGLDYLVFEGDTEPRNED